ncbi:hypothetical protein GCM10023096_32920 [Nonomuraea ferruginea]
MGPVVGDADGLFDADAAGLLFGGLQHDEGVLKGEAENRVHCLFSSCPHEYSGRLTRESGATPFTGDPRSLTSGYCLPFPRNGK